MARRVLSEDIVSLSGALTACKGRIDQRVYDQAKTVADRVDRRLTLTGDVTVVAIAGATGSGKSSLFNALSRTALATAGVQRPMTQQAMAVTFGAKDTTALLDWLGVSRRHVTASQGLDGIVLLDLADYDSVEATHREEVDRLVEIVDTFLWVVDPQKYADAVLHDRYLARFAGHAQVMAFVLNQVDRLETDQVEAIHRDFVRLLEADGIHDPVIYEVSAVSGQGIDALRKGLQNVQASKKSVTARLEADVIEQAKSLRKCLNSSSAGEISKNNITDLSNTLAEAAGSEGVGEAVKGSWKRRGALATGWPLLSWVSGLKADPLKRLHLDQFRSRKKQIEAAELTKTSITAHPVSRARVDTAVRAVGDEAASRLPASWRTAIDRLLKDHTSSLSDTLDQAVARTDLGLNEGHRWWTVVRVLQWLILVTAIGGLGWLGVNFILKSYLALPELPVPMIGNLPLPTCLAIGGVAAGLLLALISRVLVNLGASVKAIAAVRRLRKTTDHVASNEIIDPLNQELHRHDAARVALDKILK
ncbi:MAG: 50S ribosome-binding GTPase [Propionibacteriaceae bacterium]|jgi:putative protein kinase ArgK-like GTPase of G3E family|nr:50S ribosome-binding GTPase [Propionibacteriaceae bacterium]